jgi:hypothetical protein
MGVFSEETITKIMQPPTKVTSVYENFNLSNLKIITRALKAQLLVQSNPMGKTTFTFLIPVQIPLASLFVSKSCEASKELNSTTSLQSKENSFFEDTSIKP